MQIRCRVAVHLQGAEYVAFRKIKFVEKVNHGHLRHFIRILLTFVSRFAPAAISSMTFGASPSDDARSSRISTGARPAAIT
jgi:hypothetical protein